MIYMNDSGPSTCKICNNVMCYIRPKRFNCNNPKSEKFCNGEIKPPLFHDGYDFEYHLTKARFRKFMETPSICACVETIL